MKNLHLKLSVIILFFLVLLFAIFRGILLVSYWDYFSVLSVVDIITAFIQGFRFDFNIIAIFILPLLFLFNIPIKNKYYSKIILYLILVAFAILTIVLTSDIVYFKEAHKHITQELLAISNDMGFIIKFALTQFWFAILILLVFVVLGIFAINKIGNNLYTANINNKQQIVILFLILVLIVFGIRGRVFSLQKPIGIGDVYQYASLPQSANLTINGAFTVWNTIRKGHTIFTNNLTEEYAVNLLKQYLTSKDFSFSNKTCPLQRQIINKNPTKKYNVYLVLLESWNPNYIDGYTPNNPQKYNATPFFSSILKDSIVFESAYSSGYRSIMGFTSAFIGVPYAPANPLLGYGLELSNLIKIAKPFNDLGYYTFYTMTSPRTSYRMANLATGVLGVQDAYGNEDLPKLLNYKNDLSFGNDYDAIIFSINKIKEKLNTNKNFFSILFTGSTHGPFVKILDSLEKFPRDTEENKFLNALYFADYSIQNLIETAKKDNLFDDTIFIFISDHTSFKHENNIKGDFRIVFTIYAPKILKPQRIKYPVSQTDLIPTIYSILNIKAPFTAIGNNAFDKTASHFAFVSNGTDISIITENGSISTDGNKILEEIKDTPDFDESEVKNLALSVEKATTSLIKQNKWFCN
jgi:phosphoglycerol transferase MdoB-like AlkP superfamily enzyme